MNYRDVYAEIRPLTAKRLRLLGRPFKSAALPQDIQPGPVGKCFDWSAVQCARTYPKYWYVEGIATDPANPTVGILHAWLTDGIHAFDPTWQAFRGNGARVAVPSSYFGIIMPMYAVRDFMNATGHQGVLGNAWRDRRAAGRVFAEVKEVLEYEAKHGRLPVQRRR